MYTEHHLHLLSFTWNCHPSAVGLMPCWCLLYECSIFEDFAQTLILLWNCMLASPYRCISIPATLIFFTSISLSLSHGGYLPVFMLFFHLSPTSSLLNLGYALESSGGWIPPAKILIWLVWGSAWHQDFWNLPRWFYLQSQLKRLNHYH